MRVSTVSLPVRLFSNIFFCSLSMFSCLNVWQFLCLCVCLFVCFICLVATLVLSLYLLSAFTVIVSLILKHNLYFQQPLPIIFYYIFSSIHYVRTQDTEFELSGLPIPVSCMGIGKFDFKAQSLFSATITHHFLLHFFIHPLR